MHNINNFQFFLVNHPALFALMITWSIAWKGFALWKAGKNRDFIWFVILLIVNTFGILEMVYLFAIKNKEIKSETPTPISVEEVKEEEKKKEVVVPAIEEKAEEIKTEASATEEIKEEVKQETNQ